MPVNDDVFAALANPARREVLGILLDGPRAAGEIAERFDMRRPSLSEHLRVLREAGLVREERQGRNRVYSLEAAPLRVVSDWLSPYERYWRGKLGDLRDLLDEGGLLNDDDPTAVHVDQFLAHPPRKVWRALTEPQLLERWLRMPNDIKPVVGHRFQLLADPVPAAGFAGGPVACEVLAVDPERLLRISWGPKWTVTWRLEPEGRGTRLFLSHEGFDPDDEFQRMSRRIMGGGWRTAVPKALARVLDEMSD